MGFFDKTQQIFEEMMGKENYYKVDYYKKIYEKSLLTDNHTLQAITILLNNAFARAAHEAGVALDKDIVTNNGVAGIIHASDDQANHMHFKVVRKKDGVEVTGDEFEDVVNESNRVLQSNYEVTSRISVERVKQIFSELAEQFKGELQSYLNRPDYDFSNPPPIEGGGLQDVIYDVCSHIAPARVDKSDDGKVTIGFFNQDDLFWFEKNMQIELTKSKWTDITAEQKQTAAARAKRDFYLG